jgi:hypothetical protein
MTSRVTSPLSNPTEDYVRVERSVSSVKVGGWATITEAGVINAVWVNGRPIEDVSSVASYSEHTGRWELTIPVPVTNGANVVDITLFGGPDEGTCTDCFGCTFANHHFFIELKGGEQHPSTLSLKAPDDVALGDTVKVDTTEFFIEVGDKNGNIDATVGDTVTVVVRNGAGRHARCPTGRDRPRDRRVQVNCARVGCQSRKPEGWE